jgi:hypothetical protein
MRQITVVARRREDWVKSTLCGRFAISVELTSWGMEGTTNERSSFASVGIVEVPRGLAAIAGRLFRRRQALLNIAIATPYCGAPEVSQ